MDLLTWFDESFRLRIALTLLHFLWQGCVMMLVVLLAGWMLRRAPAAWRYLINLAAMLMMAACLPVTFVLLEPSHACEARRDTTETAMSPLLGGRSEVDEDRAMQLNNASPELAMAPVLRSREIDTESAERTAAAARTIDTLVDLRPLATYVTAIYVLGVAVMIFRLASGLCGGQRLRRLASPVDEPLLLDVVRREAKRIGLKAAPAIAYCQQISIPVVIGIVKPTILLPAALASGLSPDQLQAIVMHELAHIRRYDLLVNLLQRLIEALLFFHPAVWYVSRRVSIEREHAADDVVLSAGWQRVDYADALVRMAEFSSSLRNPRVANEVAALAASGVNNSDFKRRILRLLDDGDRAKLRLTPIGIAMLIAVVALGVASPLLVETWAQLPGEASTDPGEVLAGNATGTPQAPGDDSDAEEAKSAHPLPPIVGNVIDSGGHAAADADVWLYAVNDLDRRGMLVAHTRTGDDGAYHFELPELWQERIRQEEHDLTVWAASGPQRLGRVRNTPLRNAEDTGHRYEWDKVFRNRFRWIVWLCEETRTELRVLTPGGEPAAGVAVWPDYVRETDGGSYAVPEEVAQLIRAETGTDGVVALRGIALSQVGDLKLSSEAYGPQMMVMGAGKRLLEEVERAGAEGSVLPMVRLRAVGRVEGRVVSDRPEQCIGIKLRLLSDQNLRINRQHIIGLAETATDEQGRFVVPAMAEGTLSIKDEIDRSGSLRAVLPPTVTLESGETADVEIRLASGVLVTGLVRKQDTGEPLPQHKVQISYGEFVEGQDRSHVKLVTDSQGRYSTHVLPGRVTVRSGQIRGDHRPLAYFGKEEYAVTVSHDVPAKVATFELPPFELVRAAELSGRLEDADGKPLAGWHIYGFGNPDDDRCCYAKVEKNGSFTLDYALIRRPTRFEVRPASYDMYQSDQEHNVPARITNKEPFVLQPDIRREAQGDFGNARLLAADEAAATEELNQLIIRDPSRIHATALHTWNQMGWKWKVYLPPGKDWQIKGAVGSIPERGHALRPSEVTSFDIKRTDPSRVLLLEGHISRDFDGGWVLMVEADRRVFDANAFVVWQLEHQPEKREVAEYITGARRAKSREMSYLSVGSVRTKIDDRLELVRWRFEPHTDAPAPAPGRRIPGFFLWIEAKQ